LDLESAGHVENENLNIELREAVPDDEPFLLQLYASSRDDELENVGWDENQKQLFIKMQFLARERTYPRVNNRIILLNGSAVGRLLVDTREAVVLLVDIALLREYRNVGIGSRLIKDLLEESAASGKAVRLHVLSTSPAVRLYERLGFRTIGSEAAYFEMKWNPPVRGAS